MNDKERAERFVNDGEDIKQVKPDCDFCKHLHKDGLTCDAFPDGIPDAIRVGWKSHREPVDGDHGIKYEFRDV